MNISEELRRRLLVFQKNEITEHHIYERLAGRAGLPENRRILEDIARDELRHYHTWHAHTGRDEVSAESCLERPFVRWAMREPPGRGQGVGRGMRTMSMTHPGISTNWPKRSPAVPVHTIRT